MSIKFKWLLNRSWLRLMTLALALTFVCAPATSFAQQLKIAYVDLQRALTEVEEGKKAKAQLKKDFEKRQKQFNDKQEELKRLKDELERGGDMLSEDARRKRAMDFQKQVMELQQLGMTLQNELAQKEREVTRKIFDKMGVIIEQIAKERSYTFVLERNESAILYGDASLDVTDELIKRYNTKK